MISPLGLLIAMMCGLAWGHVAIGGLLPWWAAMLGAWITGWLVGEYLHS